jgi:hypothetical protein
MLNTSLHNPNVRDKPGVDRFISMNRGINEGGDLPEDLLRVCGPPSCFPSISHPIPPVTLGNVVNDALSWISIVLILASFLL